MSVPFEQQSNLELAIKQSFDAMLAKVHTINVGTVLNFTPNPPMADIQIGVQKLFIKPDLLTKQDVSTYEPIAVLKNVPVAFPSAGGLILTFPVTPGDTGIVLFNERELTQWLLAGDQGPQTPREMRTFSYSDAIFLPGLKPDSVAIPGLSTTASELRTLDGMVRLSVSNMGIKITVGGCTINFNNLGIQVQNGDVSVDGGITLKTHLHTSESPGDPTSPPIPPLETK